MHEPTIQSYQRPIYHEEDQSFGVMNLNDTHFHYGIAFFANKGAPFQFPESMGRVVSDSKSQENFGDSKRVPQPAVPCKQFLPMINQPLQQKT